MGGETQSTPDYFFFFLAFFAAGLLVLCCGGAFATMLTARWKRSHASGRSSTSFVETDLAMDDIQATRATLEDYCRLMQSIKDRIGIMLMLVQNPNLLPPSYVAEIHQLQIRMICETLAIGCLLLHGDVEGARSGRLATAYQADLIMNALEKLHPRFYPHPVRQILRNGVPIGTEDLKEGFLTKQELLQSYRMTGNFLHMRNITDFLAKKEKTLDSGAVGQWSRKLTTLLSVHTIYLADKPGAWAEGEPFRFIDGEPAPKRQIIVQMRTTPNDAPAAAVFETIGQAPPEGSG